jgi:gas vesicle structural protein
MPVKRSHHLSPVDVIDRVLDKGIVIDYDARVFVVGIDIMTTIEARMVVASISTYLERADAIAGRDQRIRPVPRRRH